MKDKLIKLLDNSYSPYYHFPVSAIVVTKDGDEKRYTIKTLCPYPFSEDDLNA